LLFILPIFCSDNYKVRGSSDLLSFFPSTFPFFSVGDDKTKPKKATRKTVREIIMLNRVDVCPRLTDLVLFGSSSVVQVHQISYSFLRSTLLFLWR
jgi:hypothetical protein